MRIGAVDIEHDLGHRAVLLVGERRANLLGRRSGGAHEASRRLRHQRRRADLFDHQVESDRRGHVVQRCLASEHARAERGEQREEVVLRGRHVLDREVIQRQTCERRDVDRRDVAEQRGDEVEHARQHHLEVRRGLGDKLAVEDLHRHALRRDADERGLDLRGLTRHLLEIEVDADVHRQVERERADVPLEEECVEVDLEVVDADLQRGRRRRVVADGEVERLLRARDEQQRILAGIGGQRAEGRNEQRDRADVELVDEVGADAETHRAGGHEVVTGEVEHRLGHAHREVRRGLGVAVERASRVERERRARGDREVRRRATERRRDHRGHAQVRLARERNVVTAEAGAGQRILVGVHAGDHAEAHRLLRAVEADVAARDDAGFHQALGAGGDALE